MARVMVRGLKIESVVHDTCTMVRRLKIESVVFNQSKRGSLRLCAIFSTCNHAAMPLNWSWFLPGSLHGVQGTEYGRELRCEVPYQTRGACGETLTVFKVSLCMQINLASGMGASAAICGLGDGSLE